MNKTFGKFFLGAAALSLLSLVGCGNNNYPVLPPGAQYPNPVTGYAGNCGAVPGGVPLQPSGQPFYSQLSPMSYQGSNSDSLSLTLSYYQSPDANNYSQNIVGSGTLNFPDINMFFPGGATTGMPTSFCVSSASPTGGTLNPGSLGSNQNLQIVLDGVMQTPYMSPFGGYSGSTGAYGQSTVEVAIGTGAYGGAGIQSGRIVGSVQITLGVGTSGAIVLQYQAQ